MSPRSSLMRSLSRATKPFQPLAESFDDAVEPARVELGALVVLEKILADDAVALGEPHQPALVADEALVDVVEVLDQRVDARLVQPQRFHLLDDLLLELLRLALLRRGERLVLELVLDVELLQAAQALERVGDLVEGLEHLGLELGLDRGERHRVLEVVLVEVGLAQRRLLGHLLAVGIAARSAGRLRLERGGAGRRRRRRHGLRRLRCEGGGSRGCGAGRRGSGRIAGGSDRRSHLLGVGAGIGRFEVDDVAQEDLALVELVAPDDDGLEGERAFAQAGDHRLAAGLDALGDRNLALAGEEFHRPHLAQIHPHRVVGALGRLLRLGFRRRLGRDLDEFAGLGLLLLGLLAGLAFLVGLGFLGLHHVDAHLAHHCQNVLDLLGGHLLRRHDRIELLVGHVAALLGLLDHLLDGGVGQIEERQRGIGGLGRLLLRRLAFLLRRGLHLGRDRLDAHTLYCHVRLHRRLSHQLNSSAGTLRGTTRHLCGPAARPLRLSPYPMAVPAIGADAWAKTRPNGQNGQRRPAPPDSGSVLTEPVKLRLTLSTAPATSILPPAKRPAPAQRFVRSVA